MRKYSSITLEIAMNLFEKYGYAVVCDGDAKKIVPSCEEKK